MNVLASMSTTTWIVVSFILGMLLGVAVTVQIMNTGEKEKDATYEFKIRQKDRLLDERIFLIGLLQTQYKHVLHLNEQLLVLIQVMASNLSEGDRRYMIARAVEFAREFGRSIKTVDEAIDIYKKNNEQKVDEPVDQPDEIVPYWKRNERSGS